MLKKIDWHAPKTGILSISLFFALLTFIFILMGWNPTHDAIGWHSAFHYFYKSVGTGTIPLWNPYSQSGTPFFPVYQVLGLLEPTNFVMGFLQRIFGFSSMTVYIFHYFFYFYIFILGTWFCIYHLTKNSFRALWMSLAFALSMFPIFIRQNGALNPYFLFPFISFFLMKFVSSTREQGKGLFLFSLAILIGISLNIHIPKGTLFFLTLFILFGLIFRIIKPLDELKYFISKSGLLWGLASLAVGALLVAPVLALFLEFKESKELIPSVRLFQHNSNFLMQCFVSGMKSNLLSEGFSHNAKHALTIWNFLAIFLEPLSVVVKRANISEILLYISWAPLYAIFLILKNERTKIVLVYSAIVFTFAMVVFNFTAHITTAPTINQRIVMTLFPFLKTSATIQNMGIPLIFSMLLLSAFGMKYIFDSKDEKHKTRLAKLLNFKIIAMLIISLSPPINILTKDLAQYMAGTYGHIIEPLAEQLYNIYLKFHPFDTPPIDVLIFLLFKYMLRLAFLIPGLFLLYHHKKFFKVVSRHKTSFIIGYTLMDLFVFAGLNVAKFKMVKSSYTTYLEENNFLATTFKKQTKFPLYRKAFTFPDYMTDHKKHFVTFMGQELYSEEAVAFSNNLKRYILPWPPRLPVWDHLYMTKYFFDYTANVNLKSQINLSGVSQPIARFIPEQNVIKHSNNEEATEIINSQKDVNFWNDHALIYDETIAPKPYTPFKISNKCLFDRRQRKEFSINAGRKFLNEFAALKNQQKADLNFVKEIHIPNVNEVQMKVNMAQDGYLYFANGYSHYWRAFLKGKELPIHRANLAFQAVKLGYGYHDLTFKFDPKRYRLSLNLYFLGLFFCFTVFLVFYIQRKRLLIWKRK